MNSQILIVEDEPRLREVLCDYFRSKGERPTQAADGLQALELLQARTFDAVLLDILIPGLDGLSVCRAVRRESDVPIVFLTALSDEEDKLLVKCWGYDYEGESRAVDTHIKRLREKLGEHAGCIKTVIKAGYKLEG